MTNPFLAQALKYLQSSGKLQPFIVEILRQYIIEQELQTRDDLDISPALTEQAVIDFRLQRQTDPSSSRSGLPVMEQITVLFTIRSLWLQARKLKAQVTSQNTRIFH